MTISDYLIRATAGKGSIRALVAATTGLVEEARRRHNAYPTAAAALGRVLTAAALLGATLKDKQTLTIRVIGDGPLDGLIAEADSEGRLRGYLKNPQVDLPRNQFGKLDVGGAVGSSGFIYVTRDLGLREPYTGSAPLVNGEIGDDVANYLLKSEQTPSAVGLGVLISTEATVKAAGGYLLQLLPGAPGEAAALLEENLKEVPSVSRAIDEGAAPEELLQTLLRGVDYKVGERKDLSFQCRCSPERARGIMLSLGRAELREMLEEDDGAELRCHFCNEVFRFSREELQEMIQQ